MPTYTRPTSRFSRLAMGASVLLFVAVAAVYAARSQLPPDPPVDTVLVRRVQFNREASPSYHFHQGWLAAAAFHCSTADSNNQVGLTIEVWKDGQLVGSDGPNGVWVANDGSGPFDINASFSVTDYPGSMLMIRAYSTSEKGHVGRSASLEIAKPEKKTSVSGYYNDGVSKAILSPGEEKTVLAMKWIGKPEDISMAFAPDGTIQVTDDDKSHLLILLKMKLYPCRRD